MDKLLKTIMMLVKIYFLSAMVISYAEEPNGGKIEIPPERGVMLSINRMWMLRDWAEWAGDLRARNISVNMGTDFTRFTVGEVGLRAVWSYDSSLDLPVDFQRYPIMVLKYRAKNTHPTSDNFVIWVSNDTNNPGYGGFTVFTNKNLIPDGDIHKLRKDLRELNLKGTVNSIAVGITCGDKTPAVFDLLAINFESSDDKASKWLTQTIQKGLPIDVLVVDSNGEPIQGAKVIVDAELKNFARSSATDSKGFCKIRPIVNDASKHMLRVEKEGMVPVEHINPRQIDDKPIEITLVQGTHYGGIIQDEEGNPIEGVTVGLMAFYPHEGNIRIENQFNILTDANGRWRSPLLPNNLIRIGLYHPDYSSDQITGVIPKLRMERLMDETSILVLKRGFSVSGIVMDKQGNPISGAIVRQGKGKYGVPYLITQTDNYGHFKFNSLPEGEIDLTLHEDGYAPELKVIQAKEGGNQVEFILCPCNTIHGRVITTDRKPVPDVMIKAKAWHGYNINDWWSSRTDSEGRFQWGCAPADEVLFDLSSTNYMSVHDYPMKLSYEGYVIVVNEPIVVKIHVVDDVIGNPVTEFDVMEKREYCQSGFWAKIHVNYKNPDGYYEHIFKEPAREHALRIIADGYLSADTPIIRDGIGPQIIEIRLKQGEVIQGIVTSEIGEVLAGAEVAWSQENQNIGINDVKFADPNNIVYVKTDTSGRFVLSPQNNGLGLLVILHEKGWKRLIIDKPGNIGEISVEPWSKVYGKVWDGYKPASDEQIGFFIEEPYDSSKPNLYWVTKTFTGKDGEFIFSHVPAGEIQIGIWVQREGHAGLTSRTHIKTIPGGVHEVQIVRTE